MWTIAIWQNYFHRPTSLFTEASVLLPLTTAKNFKSTSYPAGKGALLALTCILFPVLIVRRNFLQLVQTVSRVGTTVEGYHSQVLRVQVRFLYEIAGRNEGTCHNCKYFCKPGKMLLATTIFLCKFTG